MQALKNYIEEGKMDRGAGACLPRAGPGPVKGEVCLSVLARTYLEGGASVTSWNGLPVLTDTKILKLV